MRSAYGPARRAAWRDQEDEDRFARLVEETASTMNGDGEILSSPLTAFDGAAHVDHVTPWRTWRAAIRGSEG